jgi:hypothetical protein
MFTCGTNVNMGLEEVWQGFFYFFLAVSLFFNTSLGSFLRVPRSFLG